MSNAPQINLKPEVITSIGSLDVTNTMLSTLVVSVIIIIFAYLVKKNAKLIPSRIQVIFEALIEFFMNALISAFGDEKKARKFLPLIITVFLIIFVANQFSIIPLLSEIITSKGSHVFRTPTSDFSLPLALALLIVVFSNILAISISPLRHIGNYIKIAPFFKVRSVGDFFSACLDFFLGLLDIIGEIAKIVSLSARLFGNIFGGNVMILIIASLASFTQFFIPIPFIFLSIFSGLVHAFVFPMLSIQYLSMAMSNVQEPKS